MQNVASASISKNNSRNKKRKEDTKRCRKWTKGKLEQFSNQLSDEENCSALNLEKLALKKLSNNDFFPNIKKLLDLILENKSFRDQNNRNNFVSFRINIVNLY